MRGHRDLRRVLAAALLCALAALLLPGEALRLVFALPLTLLLPGYAIAAACFAREGLDRPRLLTVSLALSLSTLALGALLLNYAPGGIRAVSWALLLLFVVLIGCGVAARRRPAPQRPRRQRPQLVGARKPAAVLAGLGAVAAVAAIVLAGTTTSAREVLGFTELWVLPQGGEDPGGIQVGVDSEEKTTAYYDLLIRIGDRPLIRRSFPLAPGRTKLVRLDPATVPGEEPVPVVATLLRQNETDEIYRRVQSWLPPAEGSP